MHKIRQAFLFKTEANARFIIRLCKGQRPTHSLIFLSKPTQKEGESVEKRYKAITFDDRKTIASMYAAGSVAAEIAERVGVSRTSIYAELKRGQDGVTLDKNFRPAYDPALAQKRVQEGLRRRGRKSDDMEKEEVENV